MTANITTCMKACVYFIGYNVAETEATSRTHTHADAFIVAFVKATLQISTFQHLFLPSPMARKI